MIVKVRTKTSESLVRHEVQGNLKEVLVNDHFFSPEQPSIALCFKGKGGSGIVELSPQELLKLYEVLGEKVHLFKGLKGLGRLRESGSVKL